MYTLFSTYENLENRELKLPETEILGEDLYGYIQLPNPENPTIHLYLLFRENGCGTPSNRVLKFGFTCFAGHQKLPKFTKSENSNKRKSNKLILWCS